MIITLLFISVAAGFSAAWASREVRIGILIAMAGAVWVAGVLLINQGFKHLDATPGEPSALVSFGMILVLTGLAMSTALGVGRVLRGRARPVMAGLIGGGLTLVFMLFFHAVAMGL